MTDVNEISNLLEKEFRLAFSESEKYIQEELNKLEEDMMSNNIKNKKLIGKYRKDILLKSFLFFIF